MSRSVKIFEYLKLIHESVLKSFFQHRNDTINYCFEIMFRFYKIQSLHRGFETIFRKI